MQQIENMWIFQLLGETFYFPPYLILNGIAFTIGLFLLDFLLEKYLREKSRIIYISFVISTVCGWAGAHFVDMIFKNESFAHAGFTFLGGLIFGFSVFSLTILKFVNGRIFILSLNLAIIPLTLSHSIGRIGCYLSGCCYGSPLQNTSFATSLFTIHPTQLYESFFLFLLFCFLLFKNRNELFNYNATIYLIFYGAFRFLIEFLRGDYRGDYLYGFSPSQIISLGMLGLGVSLVVSKTVFMLKQHASITQT